MKSFSYCGRPSPRWAPQYLANRAVTKGMSDRCSKIASGNLFGPSPPTRRALAPGDPALVVALVLAVRGGRMIADEATLVEPVVGSRHRVTPSA
jgi:hypothetical protein